jgi:hypothetical protein
MQTRPRRPGEERRHLIRLAALADQLKTETVSRNWEPVETPGIHKRNHNQIETASGWLPSKASTSALLEKEACAPKLVTEIAAARATKSMFKLANHNDRLAHDSRLFPQVLPQVHLLWSQFQVRLRVSSARVLLAIALPLDYTTSPCQERQGAFQKYSKPGTAQEGEDGDQPAERL